MRREEQAVARPKHAILCFSFDGEMRAAAQDQHPFGFFLVVPEAGRRSVSVRDDALDADAVRSQEHFDCLIAARHRQRR